MDSEQGPLLSSFDYRPLTRVIYGVGTLSELGKHARELGGRRVLVVTDSGIVAAGHVDRARQVLQAEGIQVAVFSEVIENPTTRTVAQCVDAAKDHQADLLIGLGGGSSMDTAKGANFLLTNGGKMADYWGVGKATKPMLPMIAVPTTAGTGSEAQTFALISDEHTHVKMACGDKKAACKVAILDPQVTVTQPPKVAAVCGIDAISHALEAYVTRKRNLISLMFARQAWQLLSEGFGKVLDDPKDLEARGQMLLGAHLAGAAIENSMLGATHSAANPLTAQFDITHGVAIGIMLPHVIRFNGEVCNREYAELANGLAAGRPGADALAHAVTAMIDKAQLPRRLNECGVDRAAIQSLAEDASRQWTAQFNPRPVTPREFVSLYEAAF